MKKHLSLILIVSLLLGAMPAPVGAVISGGSGQALSYMGQSYQLEDGGEPAYQVLIPTEIGSETGLQVFPPKLQDGGEKDNWLAVQDPDGLQVTVDNSSIYIDSGTLVIDAYALSDKCPKPIEIDDYILQGNNTVWFRSYVYGSGSDTYELEDAPQRNDPRDLPVVSVTIIATVRGTVTKSSASTRINIDTKKYDGDTIILGVSGDIRIETVYEVNPDTGVAWTWGEVNRLEAGVTLKDSGQCSHVYALVETEVHSQTFYPITPVEVTPTSYNSWQDVDCSSHIASGATGVLLHIENADASNKRRVGIRKNGATDDRKDDMYQTDHTWAAIGVDANREFEAYAESASINIYLIAYTMAGVTFFTNAYDMSQGNTGWRDIDCSTEAPSAIGLIFEYMGNGAAVGFRKNGSSDSFIRDCIERSLIGAIIGCDDSQICEGYSDNVGISSKYLVGYITDGCTFNTNATDKSLGSTGSWIDLSALPANACLGFFDVPGSNNYDFGLRKNGSAEDIYRWAIDHTFAFVECDASQLIEGKIENLGLDFYLVGYAIAEDAGDPPTVVTNAATSVEDTTATLNGNVTALNDTAIECRGFAYGLVSQSVPSEDTAPADSAYNYSQTESGNWTTGTFDEDITGLTAATTYYFRAAANNTDSKWGWGDELSFLTKPAAPTNVAASDGTSTSHTTITWNASSGNVTGYWLYVDGSPTTNVGNVTAYNYTSGAPTITPGTAAASDGASPLHITLSVSGESANNGATNTYSLTAYNPTGNSTVSANDTGYRGVGSITYQWWESSGAPCSGFSQIGGGTTDPYNHTGAPAPTISANNATASDGTSPSHVTVSTNESASNGATRCYLCGLSAAGAAAQNTTSNTGYRGTTTLTYQWYQSSGDAPAGWSLVAGGTTDPYNDTTAPAPTIDGGSANATDGTSPDYVTLSCNETATNGTGLYWLVEVSMNGATSQNSSSERGFRGTDTISHQWWRSSGDAPSGYSTIAGGTTDPYNDTGGVEDPDGRYYLKTSSMTGAVSQNSTADRGYEQTANEPTVVTLNATGMTCSSTTLWGNITDVSGGNATLRGFQYGLSSGNYTWATNETGNYGTGNYSLGVSSLAQNTTYYYRALAVNGEGTGYGNETTFLTLNATLPTVTSSAATSITSSGATLQGTITDTGCAGGTCSVRGFEWGTSTGNYSWNWTQAGSYGTGAYSRAISALTANTTYYWRSLTTNPVGTNYSAERSFATLEEDEEVTPSVVDMSALIDYLDELIGGPMGIVNILFTIALLGFAIWKKGWIRVVLSIGIAIWGTYLTEFDVKVGAPLIAVGVILFVLGILYLIKQRRAEIAESESES